MTKQIATIHFQGRKLERPLYGGYFEIPAVPKGAPPFLYTINDHIQLVEIPLTTKRRPETIFAQHIAFDCVHHWAYTAMGNSTDCGPGIWIVRDVIPITAEGGLPVMGADGLPQVRPATDEERLAMWSEDLQRAIQRQERWGEWLINKGDEWDVNPKQRVYISDEMKLACEYYDRPRPWTGKVTMGDRKICQFCGTTFMAGVFKCPNCKEVVDLTAYNNEIRRQKEAEASYRAAQQQAKSEPVRA